MTWAGSYRATPTVQDFTAAATTFAVTKATGVVAGDLILLYCAGGGVAYSCPGFAGYASVSSAGTYGQILARTADGTEVSTFTVTASNSQVAAIGQVVVAGPCSIDVVGASAGATSTNPTATGLTVAGSNELLIWFGSAINSGSAVGTPVATTIPSGFTSRVTSTSSTAFLADVLVCDNTAVASGATGSEAATNATSNIWLAQMVAIAGPVTVTVTAADTGSGASTATVAVQAADISNAGVDTAGLAVTVATAADTGSGASTATVAVQAADISNAGVDTAGLAVTVATADTSAAGADAATI